MSYSLTFAVEAEPAVLDLSPHKQDLIDSKSSGGFSSSAYEYALLPAEASSLTLVASSLQRSATAISATAIPV
jgi:hypothetical protein